MPIYNLIKDNPKKNILCLFAIFLLVAVLLSFSSFLFIGNTLLAIDALSFLNFLIFLSLILIQDKKFFYLSFPFLFNFLWFSISSIILELGAYTPELRITGSITGAATRINLFFVLFLIPCFLVFNLKFRTTPDKPPPSPGGNAVYYIGFYSLILILLFVFYSHGTAFSNLVDRIVFRQEFAPNYFFPLLTALVFSSYYTGCLAGYLSNQKTFKSRLIFYSFLLSILIMILAGEKMSAILVATSLYLAGRSDSVPKIIESTVLNKRRFFILIGAALTGILFISLAVRQYVAKIGFFDFDIVINLVLDRIAQQGQLNYASDKYIFSDYSNQTLGLLNFFSREILGEENQTKGIKTLMNLFSPSDLYAIYDEAGVTFGDGFPGILYIYFGIWSYFISPFLGLFFGLLLRIISSTAFSFGYVYSVAIIFIFYNGMMSSFLNGDFWVLFDVTSSKLAALCIAILCISIASIKHPSIHSNNKIQQN
jgi:hypothetical protein